MREIKLVPTAKFYESFRNIGYNNYQALCDLIDNSLDFDVKAKNVLIEVSKKVSVITIADDGVGMDGDTLEDALQLGSKGGEVDKEDLGLFGVGLKGASLSLARRFEVTTKKEGSDYFTGVFDLDVFKEKGKAVVSIYKSTEEEISNFNSLTKKSKTGTLLTLSKIDRASNTNTTQFSAVLTKEVSQIYRHLMAVRGVNIKVNGRLVEPQDTMLEKQGSVLYNADVPKQKYTFSVNKGGKTKEVSLTIKLWDLAPKSESQNEAIRELSLPHPCMTHQGFYIIRNGRQIIASSSLGLFTKHPSFNRFRAEIFIDGDMDEILDLSLQKKEIVLPDSLKDSIKNQINPILTSIKSAPKSKSITDEKEIKVIKDIEEDLNRKERRLPAKDALREGEERDPVTRINKGGESREPKESKFTGESRKSRKNAEIVLESQGYKGDLCRFLYKGNGVVGVAINTDHVFYRNGFKELNDIGKDVCIKMLWSMGRAFAVKMAKLGDEQYSVVYDDLENLLEGFSDNFRKSYSD